MSRYFFQTNNPHVERDQDGVEFCNVAAAKSAAVRFAGQLLSDAADHFWDTAAFEMSVSDEKGLVQFTLRLLGNEAPAIRAGARPIFISHTSQSLP
jgi:hypothetical protein